MIRKNRRINWRGLYFLLEFAIIIFGILCGAIVLSFLAVYITL